jgi:hypothetical protein
VYRFDTDILSAVIKRDPPLQPIRRLASPALAERVRELVASAGIVLPFDDRRPSSTAHSARRSNVMADGSPNPICESHRSRRRVT